MPYADRMDTAWLNDFLAVMREGGFSRAADLRGVSQPAFSRRIRALEDWVGATLFDRSTHAVALTDAGEQFRPAAEEILRRIEMARQNALSAAKATSDTLRFAATHALALTFFPAWLRAFDAIEPSTASVQLTADNMVGCERLMVEGRAHFLLCHDHSAATTRLTEDAFTSIMLGTDTLIAVASPTLQMADPPHLAYSAESGMGRILTAAWAEKGWTPPQAPVFASHLASVLVAMARDGRGVAWSPHSLVAEDLAAGRLVRAGDPRDDIEMEIRLYRPKGRQTPSAEAFWAKVVRQTAKKAESAASVSSGRSS
jgi:DNA-binding transcriptional LysR family regulator